MKPNLAIQAARDIKAMCFIDQDQGRGDETRTWATLDENLAAERIQESLEAQHRKTWVLAQQWFAHLCKTTAPAWDGKSGFQSLKGYQPSKHAQQYADAARALPCPPIEATKDK